MESEHYSNPALFMKMVTHVVLETQQATQQLKSLYTRNKTFAMNVDCKNIKEISLNIISYKQTYLLILIIKKIK